MAKTETESKVSRRGFLEGMAASSVAVGALAGVKVAAQSPKTTELTTDVVVVGIGHRWHDGGHSRAEGRREGHRDRDGLRAGRHDGALGRRRREQLVRSRCAPAVPKAIRSCRR